MLCIACILKVNSRQESCCTFDVCNFGRGQCADTVTSSYGFKSFGGCGDLGPIIGTTGVQEDIGYIGYIGYLFHEQHQRQLSLIVLLTHRTERTDKTDNSNKNYNYMYLIYP